MIREAFGTAVAAGAVFLGVGEAAAQGQEQCVPVYDEINQEASPALQAQIAEYAGRGIEVHVQVLEDGTAYDIDDPAGAEAFSERLEEICGWQDQRTLSVVVSDSPRAFDIYTNAAADIGDLRDQVTDNTDEFIADLRDTDTPYQTDVSNLLLRVSGEIATPSNPDPNGREDGEGSSMPDIPLKEILFGMGGLAAVGAVVARITRGSTVRRGGRSGNQTLSDALSNVMDISLNTGQQLSILPADDAPELREAAALTESDISLLTNHQSTFDQAIHRQRRRLWPSAEVVKELEGEALRLASDVARRTKQTKRLYDEVIDHLRTNGDDLRTAREYIDATQISLRVLKDHGWQLGPHESALQALVTRTNEAEQLMDQHYIEKPGDLLDELVPEILDLSHEISQLPVHRDQLDSQISRQASSIETAAQEVEKASTIYNQLVEKYDSSCTSDLSTAARSLTTDTATLQRIQAAALRVQGVRSSAAIQESEQYLGEFTQTLTQIMVNSADIAARQQRLQDLETEIPVDVAEAQADITDIRNFIDQHGDDVEPEVRRELEEHNSTLSRLKTDEIARTKPRYLLIADTLTALQGNIDATRETAVEQKQEMDRLRTELEAAEDDARARLSALQSYVSLHRSDITDSFPNVLIPYVQLRDSRSGLRSQADSLQGIIGEIEERQSDAESQVSAARRRRQAAEDARHAASLHSSSSSYHSGGGFSSFGGFDGGGGGHSSGSF